MHRLALTEGNTKHKSENQNAYSQNTLTMCTIATSDDNSFVIVALAARGCKLTWRLNLDPQCWQNIDEAPDDMRTALSARGLAFRAAVSTESAPWPLPFIPHFSSLCSPRQDSLRILGSPLGNSIAYAPSTYDPMSRACEG